MPPEVPSAIAALIETLYDVFARYPKLRPLGLCEYCYTETELQQIKTSELRSLDPELTRKLLWETSDHWPSAAQLKHFLPRLLESFAAGGVDSDIFPGHIYETLGHQEFSKWPPQEKQVVAAFFDALEVAAEASFGEFDELGPRNLEEMRAARQRAGIYAT